LVDGIRSGAGLEAVEVCYWTMPILEEQPVEEDEVVRYDPNYPDSSEFFDHFHHNDECGYSEALYCKDTRYLRGECHRHCHG
jgi:hypothetical protein